MKIRHFWHRSSIAVFILSLSLFFSVSMASALFSSGSSDKPAESGGDGYQSDEDCGYMQGVGNVYNGWRVNFKDQPDNNQACLDAFAGASTGMFYESSSRKSYVALVPSSGTTLIVDLAPTSIAPENRANLNLSTGKWSGYGKIISPTPPKGKEFVWFDWTCKNTATCASGMSGNEPNYWVTTNMDTGKTNGFAWSDYLAQLRGNGNGFIQFNTTTLELPPSVIVPHVTIESSGSAITPGAATRDNAPQANGVDFWRVGIHFVDMVTGATLDESDISNLTMNIQLDDSVFVNQVRNKLDAVDVGTWHPTLCPTGGGDYCVMTDPDDGTVSFNKFIRSYGPTSNMVWMDEEVGGIDQDLPTDRDGCIWIYLDQIQIASLTAPVSCHEDTSFSAYNSIDPDVKWDYFYNRSDERNYIYLEGISFDIDFESSGSGGDLQGSGGGYTLSTDSSFQELGNGLYGYTPAEETELSFSPRFIIDGLYAEYDGAANWTSISEDIRQAGMYLLTNGVARRPSTDLSNYLGGSLTDRFIVYYQLDAGTNYERDALNSDVYLVMDPVDGNIAAPANNVTNRNETVNFTTNREYSKRYAMGYGQRADKCVGAGLSCAPINWSTVNYISDPTAEIWVCDAAVGQVLERRRGSGSSCYYVGYLPVLDRHAEAGGVLFMGSTSEFLGSSLDDTDSIFAGGAQETLKIRNNFYELGTRYTLGVDAGSGSLNLASSNPVSGDGVSLMGGTLYYYNGDVVVTGAESFSSSTLYVKGGDVYINGDLGGEDSRLGIVALSEDGVGGNVYIHPDVTDLYVNIFADGIVANQSPTGYDSDGFPSWLNEAYRVATLWNQLYINGSVSARMVLNQDDLVSELGYYSCDGSEVSVSQGLECSLESLRQFRLCYELDPVTGGLGTNLELCDEGESLSDYGVDYAADGPASLDPDYYPSVIMDYTAPGNLPIFASEGIFN